MTRSTCVERTAVGPLRWKSAALMCALLLVVSAHTAAAADAKFTALTATMTVPRSGHTATLLLNGQVLIAGDGKRG